MKIFFKFGWTLMLVFMVYHDALAQNAVGHVRVQGNDGLLNLRVISVADAQAAGNGVVKIKIQGGTIVAADLVATGNSHASSIRVQTPYGVRSWREENSFAFAYGGSGFEGANAMVRTSDGGYAIGGTTSSWGAGENDQLLIKTNGEGTLSWAGVYGETFSESGQSVIQRLDGGYLLLGTISDYPMSNMYLNFINSSGNSTFSGYFTVENGYSTGKDVIQCNDGNFVATGSATGVGYGNNVYLKKFNADGASIWGAQYDSGGDESANAVVQRPDGGYVVVGWVHPPNSDQDVYYSLIDSDANEETTYFIGGSDLEEATSVTPSGDGGYVFVGRTSSFGAGIWDLYLVKISAAGSIVFEKAFGGPNSDFGYDIINTNDNGFAIIGRTYSFGSGNSDIWLIKTDSSGNPQWSWVLGGTGFENGQSVTQTPDGCYYVAGSTDSYGAGTSDVLLAKFTPDGSTCLGYALAFSTEMLSLTENDSSFIARRVESFSAINVHSDVEIIHTERYRMKNTPLNIPVISRDFISPTTTTICE